MTISCRLHRSVVREKKKERSIFDLDLNVHFLLTSSSSKHRRNTVIIDGITSLVDFKIKQYYYKH